MEKSLELLCKKYEIPYHVGEYIFNYQFKYVAEFIKSGEEQPIRIRNLGVFTPRITKNMRKIKEFNSLKEEIKKSEKNVG